MICTSNSQNVIRPDLIFKLHPVQDFHFNSVQCWSRLHQLSFIWHPCHSVTFCDIIGKSAIVTFGGSMEHQSWSLFISNILVYMLLLAPSPHLVHQLVGHQISYLSFVIDQIVVYVVLPSKCSGTKATSLHFEDFQSPWSLKWVKRAVKWLWNTSFTLFSHLCLNLTLLWHSPPNVWICK